MLESLFEAIKNLIELLLNLINILWYPGIFIMMTLESTFFPFPSEAAMIPAWYLSLKWEMNIVIAFLSGTLWAIFWALINYYLWKSLWRKIVNKFWKYFFFNEQHFDWAEKYFEKHWWITTFIWRFIPAIRQYISLPAWTFKMNLSKFIIYTWIWAWIWNIVLLTIGYIWWQNEDLIAKYSHQALFITIITLLAITLIYYFVSKKFMEE